MSIRSARNGPPTGVGAHETLSLMSRGGLGVRAVSAERAVLRLLRPQHGASAGQSDNAARRGGIFGPCRSATHRAAIDTLRLGPCKRHYHNWVAVRRLQSDSRGI